MKSGGEFLAKTIYLANFGSDKLENLLAGFERHLKETDRGPSARSYMGDVKRFASWMQKRGGFNICAASPLDMIDYREYLQEYGGRNGTGAAPATVNRALISLKIFFNWLKKEGQINDNPAENTKPVAVAAVPAPKWLDRNQQAALMRTVRDSGKTRDEAMVGLMLHAGLRVDELCSLRRDDITISDRSGQVAVTGKGNKYREVPLNSTIRKILQRWLDENPEGPLFPNRYQKAISTRGVFKVVAEYAYHAKLVGVTPHTLRHTFCKNAIDRGIPIDQVAAMAGHSSLDVTKKYTTPSLADLQAAVERLAWE